MLISGRSQTAFGLFSFCNPSSGRRTTSFRATTGNGVEIPGTTTLDAVAEVPAPAISFLLHLPRLHIRPIGCGSDELANRGILCAPPPVVSRIFWQRHAFLSFCRGGPSITFIFGGCYGLRPDEKAGLRFTGGGNQGSVGRWNRQARGFLLLFSISVEGRSAHSIGL
jgi:hypothetical protein